jgi:hypothetical protein
MVDSCHLSGENRSGVVGLRVLGQIKDKQLGFNYPILIRYSYVYMENKRTLVLCLFHVDKNCSVIGEENKHQAAGYALQIIKRREY